MSRVLLIIANDSIRKRAISWVNSAPEGTRIEFKEPKRSLNQNAILWANLSDIASQAVHAGRKYTPDQWKVLFLHACGREVQFIPALDNHTFLPWGQSSSDLSKQEMSALLEFIEVWCSENNIKLHAPVVKP